MLEKYKSAEAGIARRLKDTRVARGWIQDQLAVRAGTIQAVIQSIENGHSVRPRCIASVALV